MTTASSRILVPFGSAVLFGQERGNIEALSALRDQGAEVLCLVRGDSWASEVRDALDAAGLPWRPAPYIYNLWNPKKSIEFVLHNAVAFPLASVVFLREVLRFRPTHIYAFNAVWVLNFFFAIALLPTPMVYRAGDEPTLHNAFFRWLWSFVMKRTSQFVANSRFIQTKLEDSGVPAERIAVIYSRPPTRPYGHGDGSQGIRSGSILFVGQVAEHKGVHLLVEAFGRLAPEFSDCRLVIAGRPAWDQDSWAENLMRATVTNPAIADRVKFLGYVQDTDVIFRSALVHVCPSVFDEPLANVVLEAKRAGTPSIVFPSGGLPELVQDGVDGIVCPEKTVDALVVALTAYLADKSLALNHGEAARCSLERLGMADFGPRWSKVVRHAGERR